MFFPHNLIVQSYCTLCFLLIHVSTAISCFLAKEENLQVFITVELLFSKEGKITDSPTQETHTVISENKCKFQRKVFLH